MATACPADGTLAPAVLGARAEQQAFMGVSCALTAAFAESLDKFGENMREVRPQFIGGVPRVFVSSDRLPHAKTCPDQS
jgi:hypothetical protein